MKHHVVWLRGDGRETASAEPPLCPVYSVVRRLLGGREPPGAAVLQQ